MSIQEISSSTKTENLRKGYGFMQVRPPSKPGYGMEPVWDQDPKNNGNAGGIFRIPVSVHPVIPATGGMPAMSVPRMDDLSFNPGLNIGKTAPVHGRNCRVGCMNLQVVIMYLQVQVLPVSCTRYEDPRKTIPLRRPQNVFTGTGISSVIAGQGNKKPGRQRSRRRDR